MLVRALLVLLLVLNVGVAAWWLVRDRAPTPVPVEPSPGAARLQLVGEAALEAPAAPVAATATAAMSATAAPAPAPAAAAATTAPVAMITTAMPAPPAQTPAALPEQAGGNAAPPTRRCFSFGPFASKPAADTAAAKLRPLAQKVVQRELAKKPAPQGWRVFLPPHASLEAAQAAAQRIGAAGFTDFIVVRQGPEANAVILGRYSNEEGARRHAQALAAAGFAARVEPVAAADEARPVWLDVAADAAFDPRRTQAAIRAPQHRTLDCAKLR